MPDFSKDSRIRLRVNHTTNARKVYPIGTLGVVVHVSLSTGMYYVRFDHMDPASDPLALLYWHEMSPVVSDANMKVSWEECEWNPCV